MLSSSDAPRARRLLAGAALLLLLSTVPGVLPGRAQDAGSARPQDTVRAARLASSFATHIASLSEPGGYFDTDNLISNETSYLQVLPELEQLGIQGGAYLGVGPDTNFTYIAAVRPSIAFIVDVRRDNLLLHLLFKALFELAPTRVDYLGMLLGRPAPPADETWRQATIDRLAAHFDRVKASAPEAADTRRQVEIALTRSGVPLSAEDRATIARFHSRFIESGLDLRFNTLGRPPQPNYPLYRELLLDTDAGGRQANYLASEEAYQFVRSLQLRDLVIPVVGDLSGPSALSAIGRLLVARRQPLGAFYTSNVEFYLFREGTFPKFVANLRQLPRTPRSVVIRSIFGRPWSGRVGDASTSQLQAVTDLVSRFSDGRIRSYGQLITAPGPR